jgi:hypothetical protein
MWFAPFPDVRTLINDTLSNVSPKLARALRRYAA